MVQIFIDEKAYDVEDGITVIQACESAGVAVSYTHLRAHET